MIMENEVVTYSKPSKFFHWLIAILVLSMLSVSFFLEDVPKPYASTVWMLHKSFGLSILTLMILRIVWIIQRPGPDLPVSVPVWQKFMARFVQYNLYLFVILMPLSGWIMSVAAGKTPIFFGLFPVTLPGIAHDKNLAKLMNQSHKTIAWIIICLLVLHIAGALKHHFFDKDNVLLRMLPGRRNSLSSRN
ncbi:MAG: cytochrome b [Legionella sp.]|nr:cytochrome b [Legionella sp.]